MSETESTTLPLIYGKMTEVMRAVQGVAKRDKNTHQNFNFRGIDAVMNAVGPVLREVGVIVVPNLIAANYEKVQTTTGKATTACRLEVDYTFWAEDGSSITTSVAGEAFDSGDKATPKAMSVAFRTALLQALCLPTDEPDPDSFTHERVVVNPATPLQIEEIGKAFAARGFTTTEQRAEFIQNTIGRASAGSDLNIDEAQALLTEARKGIVDPAKQQQMSESLGTQPTEAEATQAVEEQLGGQPLGEAAAAEEPPA